MLLGKVSSFFPQGRGTSFSSGYCSFFLWFPKWWWPPWDFKEELSEDRAATQKMAEPRKIRMPQRWLEHHGHHGLTEQPGISFQGQRDKLATSIKRDDLWQPILNVQRLCYLHQTHFLQIRFIDIKGTKVLPSQNIPVGVLILSRILRNKRLRKNL